MRVLHFGHTARSQPASQRWRTLRTIAIATSVLGMVLGAAGVAGLVFIRSRDSTTPIALSDAIARFDASERRHGGATPAHVPAPGVYVYETSGSERIDALGGTAHTYPAQTTITVTHSECGFNARWDALEERWDEQRVCAGAEGWTMATTASYHEFYGNGQRNDFTCSPDSAFLPAAAGRGATWSASCTADGQAFVSTAHAMQRERMEIAGRVVETLHFRTEVRNSGSTRGGATYDVWIMPETGLIARREVRLKVDTDSIVGDVAYEEAYTIQLTSLTPVTPDDSR
jgi:hypothetical protein